MITDIKIQDENYSLDWEKKLSGLSKINIFVGSNNSWKSRFLRSIFTNNLFFHNKEYFLLKLNYDKLLTFINENTYRKLLLENHISNWNLNLWDYFEDNSKILENYKKVYKFISNAPESNWWVWTPENDKTVWLSIKKFIDDNVDFSNFPQHNFKKVYVPMLRGLRGFWDNVDVYESRTNKDYFNTEDVKDNKFDIFTGLTLYENIKEMLLGDLEKRELIKEYEIFLSNNFFENQEITLIPKINSDVLNIKVWEEEERHIYNLWDWLQTIIINTFPLFKYKWEDLLLFIEEPEMTLHPWMQRKLIEVYSKPEFEKVQYFITTHSNHLLDITLDFDKNISTYSFEKESDKKYIIDNRTDNKDILDMLWVRNSSVFLSNCIIWVEWISDRLYIKKFLELYCESNKDFKKYEEDKHYSILEYGGWNITHFNFDEWDDNEDTMNIEAIQRNNFMVADNDWNLHLTDFETNKKSERLRKLKKIFWENIFMEHREIENILWIDLFKRYLTSVDEEWKLIYFKRKDLEYNESSRSIIDIHKNKIWEVIRKKFVKLKDWVDEPKYFKKNDITILDNNKADFSRDIIKIIEKEKIKFEDLDSVAKEMIINIYNFIKEKNASDLIEVNEPAENVVNYLDESIE